MIKVPKQNVSNILIFWTFKYLTTVHLRPIALAYKSPPAGIEHDSGAVLYQTEPQSPVVAEF